MRAPIQVDHLLGFLPCDVQAQANGLPGLVVQFGRDAELRHRDAQPDVDRVRSAQVLRKVELFRMKALRPETSRLVERDPGVVADVHVVVVHARRPFAGEIDLGDCRPARERQQQKQRGSLARHGVGSHPDASGIFLKCACMMSGSIRYRGSVTIVVTTSQMFFVYGSENVSKYSSTMALPLYGTPFFCKYPGRRP